MAKSIEEINKKIKEGKVVVVTAEEMIKIVEKEGLKKASKKVDVVTTGTFSPMCSSGVYLNLGHPKPRIKLGGGKCYLNGVPAYSGLAAVDIYIGATALPDKDLRNKVYPGKFKYGGGHLIEDLVAGKNIKLVATAYGTDCYPRKRWKTSINLQNLKEAIMFNIRNSYQNYNVAVNLSEKMIYTYMGVLKPNLGNANYCSAGQLSPLLKDPYYKTIGIGTKIFLGGTQGYIIWHGTQHNPWAKRKENGVPCEPGATLAVIGDLKQMEQQWLRGASLVGYGVSLIVGIGVPIPIVNEEMAFYTSVKDEEIFAPIVDYSNSYPNRLEESLGEVSYAELKSGTIEVLGKKVPTFSLSNYSKAKEIAEILKDWIKKGKFFLTKPVAPLPLKERGIKIKK